VARSGKDADFSIPAIHAQSVRWEFVAVATPPTVA
jgi:hypothetical protein